MAKEPGNMQRIPLRLFIPWDEHGRITLEDGTVVTPDTKLHLAKGTKIIRLPDGIFIKRKQ